MIVRLALEAGQERFREVVKVPCEWLARVSELDLMAEMMPPAEPIAGIERADPKTAARS